MTPDKRVVIRILDEYASTASAETNREYEWPFEATLKFHPIRSSTNSSDEARFQEIQKALALKDTSVPPRLEKLSFLKHRCKRRLVVKY